MLKPHISKKYLLNCGKDEEREQLLVKIENEANERGISTAELLWEILDVGFSKTVPMLKEISDKHTGDNERRIGLSDIFPRPFMGNRLGICLVRTLLQLGIQNSTVFHITRDVFPRTEITKKEITSVKKKMIRQGKLEKNCECLISREDASTLSMELQKVQYGQKWCLMEVLIITDYYFEVLDSQQNAKKCETILSEVVFSLPKRTTRSVEFKLRNISAVLKENNFPLIKEYEPLGNYQLLLKIAVQNKFFPFDPNRKYTIVKDYLLAEKRSKDTAVQKKSHKYYVVVRGRKPGLYDDWEDAKTQIVKYSKGFCKGFGKKPDALAYFHDEVTKIIEAAVEADSQITVSDFVKETGIKQETVSYLNKRKELGLKGGYSREYLDKIEVWAKKREEIREYLTENPGASPKEVSKITKTNQATVIDEARKNNLKLTFQKYSGKQRIKIEEIQRKEAQIRDYLAQNPYSDAKRVARDTGRSLARIYALAREEKLPLSKSKNVNETGQRNRKRIKEFVKSKPNLDPKEIAHQVGLSLPTVYHHLDSLGIKRKNSSRHKKRRLSKKYEKLKVF